MEVDRMTLEDFAEDLDLRGFSKVARDNTVWAVKRYLKWASLEGIDPQKGRKEDVLSYLAYLRAKGLKRATLANNFTALSNWFEFLVESGELEINPIPLLKKRYLQAYKDDYEQRQIITVEQATKMVRATIDTRDRAILLLLLKTGIRRNELVTLDLEDVDMPGQKITLKPTGKRSNRIVFFDHEAARSLIRWISVRETRYKKRGENALFISMLGTRLQREAINRLVREAAERVGLYDSSSKKLEDKFTPHCCRHFLTTQLLRNNMRREYVQWLRGDSIHNAIDIYFHINPEDVKQSYLACVPELGV
jgi:integrase/recombinase XerD